MYSRFLSTSFAVCLLFIFPCLADATQVSFDQLAVSSDLTVVKWNQDMNTIFQAFNSGIGADNIQDDSVGEPEMADNANPRLRTYEGASCEKVYTGLLPTTTSGTLVGSVPSGTAYPLGYRVVKSSSTAKTWTATKWTFVDIDINGNFTYSEVTIDGATPSVATNSIRLARVSTDGTQVTSVQDLRTTSCTAGPFENISDSSGQATLDDMFAFGQPVRRFSQAGRTTQGIARGMFVSWDSHTTFTVTSGAAYINGKFRAISTDTTVTTANDAPSTGGSGLDTSSVGASTRYYVYAVADQDAVKTPSFTYSTNASAPVGVTNYRLIGSIVTDGSSLFTSRDVITAGGISEREIVGGWVTVDQATGSQVIKDSFNVSSISDGGAGLTTVTWDADFNNANYALSGMGRNTATAGYFVDYEGAPAVGSVALGHRAHDNTLTDGAYVTVIAFGDTRK